MQKLITIFGTRPEIIRLSMLFPKLDKAFDHKMINTYQNNKSNLNDLFLSELNVRKPDYNLDIDHSSFGVEVGDIISKTFDIIKKEKPDKVLILGDTYSGLSVLSAKNLGVKVYHMEAGMRSGDWRMPEEKNRRIVDHLADVNLPYTNNSRDNLIREGINPLKTFVTGNPIFEVLENNMDKINSSKILDTLKVTKDNYYLMTIHRVENVTNEGVMKNILKALEFLKLRVIVLAHPRFVSSMAKFNLSISENITIIDSVGFFDFVTLERHAKCVLTDSGTVPEECAYFNVPCITIRDSTERQELVEIGSNIVAGTKTENILHAISMSEHSTWEYKPTINVSDKIVKILNGIL